MRIALRCALTVGACTGTVTLRARFATVHRDGRKRVRGVSYVTLGHAHFHHGRGTFAVTVKLRRASRALLRRHHGRLALQVILSAPASPARKLSASLTAAH